MTDSGYIARLQAAQHEHSRIGMGLEDIALDVAAVLLKDIKISGYIARTYGRITNDVAASIVAEDLMEV